MRLTNLHLRHVALFILLLFSGFNGAAQQAGKPNPNEVIIGPKTWMRKNLDVDKYRNGDAIIHAATAEEWQKAGAEGKGAWCYYDNDPEVG
ncbi:MAG: hypothetical protein ACKORJ_13465, partial [Bacteroidota bacterium]